MIRHGGWLRPCHPPSQMQVLLLTISPFLLNPDMEFTQREVMEDSKFTPWTEFVVGVQSQEFDHHVGSQKMWASITVDGVAKGFRENPPQMRVSLPGYGSRYPFREFDCVKRKMWKNVFANWRKTLQKN